MAKVILTGITQLNAIQLGRALQSDRHDIQIKSETVRMEEILDADIIFAGGAGKQYLPLLRAVRQKKPELAFIVVTSTPETGDWLDALEAGATDYCSAPFEPHQINWLMENVLRRHARTMAA